MKNIRIFKKGESDLVTCSGSLFLIFGLFVFINYLLGPSTPPGSYFSKPKPKTQPITAQNSRGIIYSFDSATGRTIDPVNIFAGHNPPSGLTGKTSHGEPITILEKASDGWMKIKTDSGVTGWISGRFVKEN